MLEDEPYAIVTADSAERALALADTRRLPVVFLTAQYANARDAVRGLDLGACDYITKPFDVEELRARVRAVLRLKREHDEAESDLKAHTGKLKVDIAKLHEEKHSLEGAAARSERLAAELEEMQRRASVEPQTHGRILAVYGAKGGVGQSVIAANLAIAIGGMTKKRVALLDANIQSGDVGALLELSPKYDLSDLLERADDLDAELMDAVLAATSGPTMAPVLPAPNEPARSWPVSTCPVTLAEKLGKPLFAAP